ncbi:MAG TPA: hypothetical protein VFG87_00710 [Amycolatopsis sp.]|nr:hypothetical protein [Amycolatopsis sp.]
MNVATRRGTIGAGRWLARALLVCGGAVAGTAIAWAIGTTSASATPLDSMNGAIADSAADRDVPELAGGRVSEVVHLPAHRRTGDQAGQDVLQRRIVGEVRDTMHEFTRDAVLDPAKRLLGSVERIVGQRPDLPGVLGMALTPPRDLLGALGAGTTRSLVKLPALPILRPGDSGESGATGAHGPVTTALPATPPVPVAGDLRVADRPAGTAHLGSGPRQDSRLGAAHTPHPFSAPRDPLSPAGLPVGPSGSVAGGHADGPLFAVPVSALLTGASAGSHAVRFGIRNVPVQPGTQPGVTPD